MPSHFEVLDETAAALLMAEALDQVLARAGHDPELAGRAVWSGRELSGQDSLMDLIREARHASASLPR